MTKTNTLEETTKLRGLAKEFRSNHEEWCFVDRKCRQLLVDGLIYAIAAGNALMQAKEILPHGEFMPWVEKHGGGVSHASANNYMRVALNSEELQNLIKEGACYWDALKFIGRIKPKQLTDSNNETTKGNEPCQESNKVEPSPTLPSDSSKPKTASTEPSLPRQSPWAPETPGETQSDNNPESSGESTGDYSTGQETHLAEAGSELSQSSQLEPQTFPSSPSHEPDPFEAVPDIRGENEVSAAIANAADVFCREVPLVEPGRDAATSIYVSRVYDTCKEYFKRQCGYR